MRTASAVEAAGRTAAPGSSARRKRAHCASGCGWETTAAMSRERELLARDEAVADGEDRLAEDHRVGRVPGQRVERRGHPALQRVLDRHQRAVDGAPSTAVTVS